MKRTIYAIAIALLVSGPVGAKTKKAKVIPTPTPLPKASPNTAVMNQALKFWVYEKGGELVGDVVGLVDSKEKKVVLKCGLMNLTKKDIRGVRGIMRFTTLFGEYIGDISLETTELVPAGQRVSIEWKAGADRFTPEGLQKFQKLKLEEMRQTWYPRTVVFTDGAILK